MDSMNRGSLLRSAAGGALARKDPGGSPQQPRVGLLGFPPRGRRTRRRARPARPGRVLIAPVLFGEPPRRHEYLYWESRGKAFRQAVRMGDWKEQHESRLLAMGAADLPDLGGFLLAALVDVGEVASGLRLDEHRYLIGSTARVRLT